MIELLLMEKDEKLTDLDPCEDGRVLEELLLLLIRDMKLEEMGSELELRLVMTETLTTAMADQMLEL